MAHRLDKMTRSGRIVLVRVGNPEPAARAKLARFEMEVVAELDEQVEHDLHRLLVSAERKDLRADVRVEAYEFESGMLECLLDGRASGARLDREIAVRPLEFDAARRGQPVALAFRALQARANTVTDSDIMRRDTLPLMS